MSLPRCGLLAQVMEAEKCMVVDGVTYKEGTWISINGLTGEVISGQEDVKPPEISGARGL